MRNLLGLLAIGLLTVGCGSVNVGPRLTGDKLYEAVGQSILVIDSRNHAVERRLPIGAPSPDWKHLYSMLGDSLVDTNPGTDQTQNTVAVGAEYELPLATHSGLPGGLSPNGWWLVLEAHLSSTTHLAIIDTTTFRLVRDIQLAGRFDFDAISDDGLRLYLIQYLNGKEYYVRLFDVASNRLDANIVVDKSDGSQAMAGLRLSGIASPDGGSLFSMYVRENESPFIHALSLQGPFAFCLDLPGGGYAQGKATVQWALAMTHDGSKIYAINGAQGTVAVISGAQQFVPQVQRTGQIQVSQTGATGANSAAISLDGQTLVTPGSSGLVWVDTSTLSVRMESLREWRVWSLGLSPDGKTLYAVNDSGQVAEIVMASGAVGQRFDPGAGKPIALMRVSVS